MALGAKGKEGEPGGAFSTLGRVIGQFRGDEKTSNGKVADMGLAGKLDAPLPSNGEIKELKLGDIGVREMDLTNKEEAGVYVGFLNDKRHWLHFAHPPRTVEEMIATKEEKDHFLVITKVERVEGKLTEVVVGGARLSDNTEHNENEDWISLWVVDPNKQKQGIGRRSLRGIADWAYEHPRFDGRKRDHLHLAVNMGIEGDEEVMRVVRKAGFNAVQKKLAREVNYWYVSYADGSTELSPTNRDSVLFGEKLEFKEIERPDGTRYEKAVMENGTVVEIVKKPTKRFGMSFVDYLEDRNPKHKVLRWQRRNPRSVRLPQDKPSQERLF